MTYKTFVSMNIAIIGGGKTSGSLAHGLAIAGHEIFIGLKEGYGAVSNSLLDKFKNVSICTLEEAAAAADIIIIATDAKHVREVAYWLDDVRGKVIIDATNFISVSSGEEINTVGAIKAITGSPYVVKVFNCTDYQNILDVLFKEAAIDMFVAGDSKIGREVVKILAKDMGFAHCYDFGNNSIIPLLDEMAICWSSFITRKNNNMAM